MAWQKTFLLSQATENVTQFNNMWRVHIKGDFLGPNAVKGSRRSSICPPYFSVLDNLGVFQWPAYTAHHNCSISSLYRNVGWLLNPQLLTTASWMLLFQFSFLQSDPLRSFHFHCRLFLSGTSMHLISFVFFSFWQFLFFSCSSSLPVYSSTPHLYFLSQRLVQ